MFTDETRVHATTPGHVEHNPVFVFHRLFNPKKDEVAWLQDQYVAGKIGDVDAKNRLSSAIGGLLAPIRTRSIQYRQNRRLIADILCRGADAVGPVVSETLAGVAQLTNIGQADLRAFLQAND